ncbi:MAG: AAA family ATPase [Planctomycetales bacterium]|nr:AAA family ATPase [Planctomycetales bacterium]
MYHEHWNLSEPPYRDGLDLRGFQRTPVHEEALARMDFLLDGKRRLGLLLGPEGAGKSLLLNVFADQLRRRGVPIARVDLMGIDAHELCWQIATSWRTPAQFGDSMFVLWRRLADRVQEFRAVGVRGVLLLDNADEAERATLQHVVRLLSVDPTADAPLTAIVAARPQRIAALGERLPSLASLRIDVTPLEVEETKDFVIATLAQAGRTEATFDEEAIETLHDLTGGNPRHIRQLADLALIAGAGEQTQQINRHTVQAAYEELTVR